MTIRFAGDFETRNYFGSYVGLNPYTVSGTAIADDAGKLVTVTAAGATTYTFAADVPPTAQYDAQGRFINNDKGGLNFPIGTKISVLQLGAGAVTLTAGAGVTFVKSSSQAVATVNAYDQLSAVKIAANTWLIRA